MHTLVPGRSLVRVMLGLVLLKVNGVHTAQFALRTVKMY